MKRRISGAIAIKARSGKMSSAALVSLLAIGGIAVATSPASAVVEPCRVFASLPVSSFFAPQDPGPSWVNARISAACIRDKRVNSGKLYADMWWCAPSHKPKVVAPSHWQCSGGRLQDRQTLNFPNGAAPSVRKEMEAKLNGPGCGYWVVNLQYNYFSAAEHATYSGYEVSELAKLGC